MATRADKEAMAAALGGMVSRPETQEKETEAVRAVAPSAPMSAVALQPAVAPSATRGSETGEDSEYRRTGTGYVKTDGTELVRTVVMMTEGERRRLKIEAMERGISASDHVRRALGFL